MPDTVQYLNNLAEKLERTAIASVPTRRLAAAVLAVATARVLGETPEPERAALMQLVLDGLRATLAGYGVDIPFG